MVASNLIPALATCSLSWRMENVPLSVRKTCNLNVNPGPISVSQPSTRCDLQDPSRHTWEAEAQSLESAWWVGSHTLQPWYPFEGWWEGAAGFFQA